MAASLIEYWREISMAFGGVVTFLAGYKSSKLAERNQKISAVDAMQKTYDVFLEHYKEQMKTLLDRVSEIELRNAFLTEAAENWKKKYDELLEKYKQLENKLKVYEKDHKK